MAEALPYPHPDLDGSVYREKSSLSARMAQSKLIGLPERPGGGSISIDDPAKR